MPYVVGFAVGDLLQVLLLNPRASMFEILILKLESSSRAMNRRWLGSVHIPFLLLRTWHLDPPEMLVLSRTASDDVEYVRQRPAGPSIHLLEFVTVLLDRSLSGSHTLKSLCKHPQVCLGRFQEAACEPTRGRGYLWLRPLFAVFLLIVKFRFSNDSFKSKTHKSSPHFLAGLRLSSKFSSVHLPRERGLRSLRHVTVRRREYSTSET